MGDGRGRSLPLRRRNSIPVLIFTILSSCATEQVPRGATTHLCETKLPDGSEAVSIRVPPIYPRAAMRAGTTGFVTTTFDIDLFGRTENVVVDTSEPPGVFDSAATIAIRQWVYCPGSDREENVSVTLNFDLGN